MGVPFPDDLRQVLAELNARAAEEVGAAAGRLGELVETCGRYAAAVTGFEPVSREPAGAAAVVDALWLHPAFRDGRLPLVGEAVFGPATGDPADFDARRETAEFLLTGLAALVAGDRLDEKTVRALVGVGIGADVFSRLVRDVVLGGGRRDLDLDLEGLLPDRLIDLEKLERIACARGIADAAVELGRGAHPGRAWAKGIRNLDPNRACPGDTVVIHGLQFGATQPAGVEVMFPSAAGGCVPAQVTAWSNTAVTVVVPAGVGIGCVGLAEAGTPLDVEAVSTFAGVLEQCIGPAAFAVAEKVRLHGGVAPPPPCPGCLPGKANRFSGGGPVVDFFTANLGHDVTVEPGDRVILRWSVRNATSLTLTRAGMQGPFAPPPVPMPASGMLDLGAFTGSVPAAGAYTLTAANRCGVEPRTVTVRMRRTPALKIDAIEVVQVIQRPDNSVRLVSQKRTVARVFVDSGVTDGFDFGAGPNVVDNLVGTVTAFPVGRGFGTPGTRLPGDVAWAVPAASRNRGNPAHSLDVELPLAELRGAVRIEARVAVAGHENDVGGPWTAFATTTVRFTDQPVQVVLPMPVSDPLNGLPAPSVAAFNSSLQEARKRYPVAESGWIVNPPIPLQSRDRFGNAYDLSTVTDWGRFLDEIQMMLLLFSSTPTGGVRTAVVPNNGGGLVDAAGNSIPAYALNGIALPRQAPTLPPVFLAQAGLTGTYAHELGHTFRLDHAPCPPLPGTPGTGDCSDPPSGIDPRLPGRTDEVGFDVPARAVIESGRGELMSYCGDSSRCPGTTRWPSIVTWDLLFNSIPVA